jgi:hypothetical protein
MFLWNMLGALVLMPALAPLPAEAREADLLAQAVALRAKDA